jgi:hypothetical protein
VLATQLALCRNDSAKAIEELQAAVPYEMGNSMQAIYLRGQTYLALHEGAKPQPNSRRSSTMAGLR